MIVVLDASAAIGAVAGERKAVVTETLAGVSKVVTPDLFIAEVTNGLWKYVFKRLLTIDEAMERFGRAMAMVNGFEKIADLAEEALREASAYRHPAYDLYYAVLARRENAAILSFDGRLKDLCGKMRIPLADA